MRCCIFVTRSSNNDGVVSKVVPDGPRESPSFDVHHSFDLPSTSKHTLDSTGFSANLARRVSANSCRKEIRTGPRENRAATATGGDEDADGDDIFAVAGLDGCSDAAGLAVANKMQSQLRGMNIALKNTADGLSLLQTAIAGMQTSLDISQRLRELAVQSHNVTSLSF